VSCRTISRVELDSTIPVRPPKVKRAIKPKAHQSEAVFKDLLPYRVLSQLNTLMPVGIAIIMVAAVK
jgi:hypothetical protein